MSLSENVFILDVPVKTTNAFLTQANGNRDLLLFGLRKFKGLPSFFSPERHYYRASVPHRFILSVNRNRR